MEKLSIEEKAKAYDEALERASEFYNNEECRIGITPINLEVIFPELKESEDERIRKNIIATIHLYYGEPLDDEAKEMIAWLEKQCNLMKALQISNAEIGELIEKNYYLKEQLEKQGNNIGISEVTKQKLEDNLNKALEKETPESCNEFLDEQGSKEENLKERNICDTCEDSNGCLIPCCAKLLEKQGEQKPTEFDDTNAKRMFIKALERVEEQNNKGYKLTDCDKNSWWEDFKTYTSRTIEQKTAVIIPKFRIGDTIRLKNSNAEHIITDISDGYYRGKGWALDIIAADESNDYELVEKSLTAWSEEDEKMIQDIINDIAIAQEQVCCKSRCEDEINWLKSIRPHKQWKPTKEQMDALLFVVQHYTPKVTDKLAWDSIKILELMYYEIKQ